MTISQQLANYFKASFPCIGIQTTEEARALADIMEAARATKRDIAIWSATEGMSIVGENSTSKVPDSVDLQGALRQRMKRTVTVLRDPHTWPFDRFPVLLRSLRDFLAAGPKVGSSCVILADQFRPHATIEKMCTILDYTLPNDDDLTKICQGIAKNSTKPIEITNTVIRALRGLTTTEAENAVALSFIETSKLSADVIYREKIQVVKKSELLEIIDADPRGLDAVGGLDELKIWINKRRKVWSPEAEKFGLPSPKGIMIVGMPGSGKSLCAKAIGTALAIPTLKLDIGKLFNSLIGESEARTRAALRLADAISPCVLWLDEADKALAGSGGSGNSDSGVAKKVFGIILTWMQERKSAAFLVVTANTVTDIPPEFLRKGRFDEIFAVDLPSYKERIAIFSIHLTSKKRDPKKFDLAVLARVSEEFTGSEIEAVINEGMFSAFDSGRELSDADILEAIKVTIPLARTAKDQIAAIREWAQSKARFASTKEAEDQATIGQRQIGN